MNPKHYPEIDKVALTCGYQYLPPKQRQIIRLSLMFQDRIDKMGEAISASLQRVYHSLNCHLSVMMLETGEYTGHLYNENIPKSFFQAKYSTSPIDDLKDLKKALPAIQPPIVAHISISPGKILDTYGVLHTLLILDNTDSGDLVIWEKRGTYFPFRVTSSEEQFKSYSGLYWGFRPLQIQTKQPSFLEWLFHSTTKGA